MIKDVQGTVFEPGQKISYVYQSYKGSAITLKIGYIKSLAPKSLKVVNSFEAVGLKDSSAHVIKPTRAVVLGVIT